MKDDFQHRIYNYEVTPPARSWEKIAEALDQTEHASTFSSKLYNLESTPPALAWENIEASLDTTVKEIQPTGRRISLSFFKYAAAVLILGLMVWGAVTILNNKKNEIAEQKNIPAKNNIQKDSLTTNEPTAENKDELTSTDLPDEKKSTNLRSIVTKKTTTDNSETNSESTAATTDADNIANRYIALMTPDGNMIRMSKKWADMVCCVSGSDDEPGCKDQLQKWREQIACSPLAPSAGNFMDILSLVSSLQNN